MDAGTSLCRTQAGEKRRFSPAWCGLDAARGLKMAVEHADEWAISMLVMLHSAH
jgi:hypothetical protein